jgi:aldose 1-epimerase
VQKSPYGTASDGKAVDQFTLANSTGSSVSIITYGAIVTHVTIPDKNGKLGDVVLGFDDLAGYQSKDNPYFGASVGRVANRIAKGTYSVDGTTYHCAINNAPNTLHGGRIGYDKRVWDASPADSSDGSSVKFSLTDPDGAEGFPGTVKVELIFTLTDKNIFRIEYSATTDKPTPINLTNHSYWNLKDAGQSPIAGHILRAHASAYLPVDQTQIPTGEIAPVKGTPIDFTVPKPIGKDLLSMAGNPPGYDHCLILDSQSKKLAKAAEVYEPHTGRLLQVWTTEPGLQFYTGNFLAGHFTGKAGIKYAQHSAFAFEAQNYPDAINQPAFPNSILRPGQTYHQITEYHFAAGPTQPF